MKRSKDKVIRVKPIKVNDDYLRKLTEGYINTQCAVMNAYNPQDHQWSLKDFDFTWTMYPPEIGPHESEIAVISIYMFSARGGKCFEYAQLCVMESGSWDTV